MTAQKQSVKSDDVNDPRYRLGQTPGSALRCAGARRRKRRRWCSPRPIAAPTIRRNSSPARGSIPVTLRRSEDCYVDELFAAAPEHGAPLLRALFPRAFVDPNREPFELDPTMFEDALPAAVNTGSPRVAAGLGTIARVVANGEEIYARKLHLRRGARRASSAITGPITRRSPGADARDAHGASAIAC